MYEEDTEMRMHKFVNKNPRDALHHGKRPNFKTVMWP